MSDKRWLLAALVVGVGCLAGSLALLRPPSEKLSRKLPSASNDVSEPEPPALALGGAQGSSLYTVPKPMTLAELFDIVKEEMPTKVSEEFVVEFNNEPELRAIWDEAKARATSDKDFPAAEIVAKLMKHPKMRALARKFDGQPAFRSAFQAITGREEVDRLLHEEVPAVAQAANAGKDAKEAARTAAGSRAAIAAAGGRQLASLRGGGDIGARSGFAGGIGAGGAAVVGGGAVANRPGGAHGEDSAGPDGTSGATTSSSAGSTPETDAHETTGLTALAATGPGQDAIAFYLSLFGRTDPGLRQSLEGACDSAIADNRGCGIIDLCWSVGMARCRAACAAAGPACTISFPPDPPPAASDPGGGSDPGYPDETGKEVPEGGKKAPAPNATNYGGGLVYDNGAEVMTYGGTGPSRDGYWSGYVAAGDSVVGTYYTNQATGGGTVEDANGNVIYEYDNQGGVTTCPCK